MPTSSRPGSPGRQHSSGRFELTASANGPYSWWGRVAHAGRRPIGHIPGATAVSSREEGDGRQVVGFLGVGLDNKDGHQRLTRSDNFLLVGGSAETHGRMQDTAIRFGEALRKRGKTLQETSAEEALDLLRESLES
jgi:glycine/D-amino acid oxidase-like deaminating enzyme